MGTAGGSGSGSGPRDDRPIVVESGRGRAGELVLLRRGDELQVVCDGTFLIADSNEWSSRALVAAARQWLPDRPLDVLIGGLGMGYALDEDLESPQLHSVTVAEFEPLIVAWFERHMRARASRVERDARARIVVADVHDVLAAGACYDLIALDTDNGPEWLVREDNARLYDPEGVGLVASAVRDDGVVVFWSPERYVAFERTLGASFARVEAVGATDEVDGRALDYTMYVCLQPRR